MTQLILSGVNYQSESFQRVLSAVFSHKLSLFNSMLTLAPDQLVPPVDGDYASIPQWDVISGAADKIVNGLTTTINAPTQFKHRAAWVEREKAWGADEIIMTIAGSEHDATRAIAEMWGEYWAGQIHASALKVVDGVFGDALLATHVMDDSGKTITPEAIVAAKLKLGDNGEKLNALALHSKVMADATILKMVTYDRANVDSFVSGSMPKIVGLNTYVTDKLAATNGVYPSLLGMPGSILYKTRPRQKSSLSNANIFNVGNLSVELVRDGLSNGGVDKIVTRLSYLVYVPGVQYDDTGGINPTDTVLATSTSWTKVQTDDKLIPLVLYKSA